ncbi:Phosphatase PHOSPHO-type [Macleaya cordata]|uniref:Phosphatase PHOSPHO-type n=1 Tax=Macleaya cordata TaxID=56857 RepID=A0A200QLG3_MACCD|nr:Phosphatase PHOSPHO-type [Macleaya cordata]
MATGIVVVFDFDHTIIDCDSDDWIFDHFGVTKLFNELLLTMSWNSCVDWMMKEIQTQGRTIQEIAECLKRVPLHTHIITAIKSAHALGCDLRIVSDANVFFIETILKHYGLLEYFSEINTNPSFIDEQGRLRILPFTSFPHGCTVSCPTNMCKGKIIERIRASSFGEGKKQLVYIGDGKGDFCPSLKLREGDYVMPRKNYPVWELICSNSLLIKAEIHEWRDGDELEHKLLRLLNTFIITDEAQNSMTMNPLPPICSTHQLLPQALPVPPY